MICASPGIISWKVYKSPPAFLDRDGTLNHDSGYTHKVEEFRWVKGAKDAIKYLNDAGYLVFIVTNQAGIARGYYDADAVEALHDWMQLELAQVGAHIDDIRYCPHHPQGKISALSRECDCRKPNPGMLQKPDRCMAPGPLPQLYARGCRQGCPGRRGRGDHGPENSICCPARGGKTAGGRQLAVAARCTAPRPHPTVGFNYPSQGIDGRGNQLAHHQPECPSN